MIPQSWTDYVGVSQRETQRRQANQCSAVLASVSELLHTRVVLAPLLALMQVADSSGANPPEGESNAAATKLRTRVIGSSRAKSHSLVNIEANQRNETLAVLARLLAKTVKASPNADAAVTEKRGNHD